MFENFTPWASSEVELMEGTVGVLPEPLKDFLLTNGAGGLDGMRVVPSTEGNGLIGSFCSFVESRRMGEVLFHEIESFAPPFVVVAYGAGGRLCVKVNPESYGRVVWVDEDRADELGAFHGAGVDENRFAYEIAGDWSEFLSEIASWQVV